MDLFVEFVYPGTHTLQEGVSAGLQQEDAQLVDALAASDEELEGATAQLSLVRRMAKRCRSGGGATDCNSIVSLRRKVAQQHKVRVSV